MGAPAVIPTPSKSYVAINSIRTDRSIPPTMCDLGRVSNLAAAVILPRTSNFVTRNNNTQNTRSIPHRKRPISEVLGYSNSNTLRDNTSSALSITNQPNSMCPHANRSCTHGTQLSNSATITSSTVETNPERRHDLTSQAKRLKLESAVTISRLVSSPEASTENNQKNISVSVREKTQINLGTQYHTSQSINLPPHKPSLMPVQLPSKEAKAEPPKKQHPRLHTPNNMQLPNQQAVPLLTPEMGNLPTQGSLPIGMQLQQQNQQLHNTSQQPNQQAMPLLTPGMVKLPNQISHSIGVQLQQQNQQLRNENVLLQKQLSLFRQLMKNPQRLNQVLTLLEQRVL